MADRIINHEAVTENPVTTSNIYTGRNFTQDEKGKKASFFKTPNDGGSQKQIELAAKCLAQIFIQQAMSKKNPTVNKQIETQYGKPNRS